MTVLLFPDAQTVHHNMATDQAYEELLAHEDSLPPPTSDEHMVTETTFLLGLTVTRNFAWASQLEIDEVGEQVFQGQRSKFVRHVLFGQED